MRTFGPAFFHEDTEFTEPFKSMGPATAKKNLKGLSIKIHGSLKVEGNLDIDEMLKVNGPLGIYGTLTSHEDSKIKINGPVTIRKGILGGKIKVNGPFKAEYADVTKLIVNGPTTVPGDIIAKEEIRFSIGFTRTESYFNIGGVIEAPIVHFRNFGIFRDRIPGFKTIKRVFGLQPKYTGIITLENLRIKTQRLILEGVEIINSEIQADKIEEFEPEFD